MDALETRKILQRIQLGPRKEDDNAGCAKDSILPETIRDECGSPMALLVSNPGDEDGEEDECDRQQDDNVRIPEAVVAFCDLPGIGVSLLG
jgi:hypothetical protein